MGKKIQTPAVTVAPAQEPDSESIARKKLNAKLLEK
jgi:hypothetical protein